MGLSGFLSFRWLWIPFWFVKQTLRTWRPCYSVTLEKRLPSTLNQLNGSACLGHKRFSEPKNKAGALARPKGTFKSRPIGDHVCWSSTFMGEQDYMARCPLQNCQILQSDGWDKAHVVTGRTPQSGASGPIYVQNQAILRMTSWQVEVRSKNWIDRFKNDCWRRAHKIQTMECGWNWQTAPMALTCMDALVNMWRQPPLNKPPVHFL